MITIARAALLIGVSMFPLASAGEGAAPIADTSRVWVTGQSSLRFFTCRAGEVRGAITPASEAAIADVMRGVKAAAGAEVVIPVASLDCGNRQMNRDLRQVLRASVDPTIEFRLDSYEIIPDGPNALALIDGSLRIAGMRNPVSMMSVIGKGADGALHASGFHRIELTDYGIWPPSRFFGLLKVDNTVVVHFDVVLPG